ncbi:MAG: hypothetical protein VB141_11080 [Burkholderia gladioli]
MLPSENTPQIDERKVSELLTALERQIPYLDLDHALGLLRVTLNTMNPHERAEALARHLCNLHRATGDPRCGS